MASNETGQAQTNVEMGQRLNDSCARINRLAWLAGEDSVAPSPTFCDLIEEMDEPPLLGAGPERLLTQTEIEEGLADEVLDLLADRRWLGFMAEVYFPRRSNFTEHGHRVHTDSSWVHVIYAETLSELVEAICAKADELIASDQAREAAEATAK